MDKNERIKIAIKEWDNVKSDAGLVKNLLDKGNFFMLNKNDVNDFNPYVDEKLYAYMGVENKRIILILVPDSLDKKLWTNMSQPELEAVKIKEYVANYGLAGKDFIDNQVDGKDITVIEALKRHHRWNIMKESYLNAEVNHKEGLFQLFNIPFAGINDALSSGEVESLCFSFGLVKDMQNVSESGFYSDLIAWSIMLNDVRLGGSPLDMVLPVPPYRK